MSFSCPVPLGASRLWQFSVFPWPWDFFKHTGQFWKMPLNLGFSDGLSWLCCGCVFSGRIRRGNALLSGCQIRVLFCRWVLLLGMVNLDLLAAVVSARSLCCEIPPFPFVVAQYLEKNNGFFFWGGAAPVAYGGSQDRRWIGAAAAGHITATASWIFNPLSEARDWTCVLMDTCWVCYCWATTGAPEQWTLM